jgi:dihydrolipoamide dehydrogenase
MGNTIQLAVIGGGVGGYPAAIQAARMGAQVTLIEKELIGGTCLNWGCIPTKSLLQTGEVVRTIRESQVFGVHCDGFSIDFAAVMARKNQVVEQLRKGVERLLSAKKIRVVRGTAKLVDAATIEVEETGEKLKSDRIILATGSKPSMIPIKGAERADIWDSNRFLTMESLPKKAVIIGGGVIGVEFAQILNRMGSDVTILEILEGLLPGVDREIGQALEKSLVQDGIRIFTGAGVTEVKGSAGKRIVLFNHKGERKDSEAECVIFAVGRKPNLTGLNAEKVGLATRKGFIVANERMETNVPGIYAVGDVIGGIMLAHVATAEAECAVKNAMGQKSTLEYKAIPSCVYTHPEIGSVGLSEESAKEKYDIQVGRFPFYGCGKALVMNETYGMVKIVSERKHGEVLGVHIIGPHATDMIAEAVLGMGMEMTVEELAHAVHPHPTLSEAIMESALSLCGGAIHMP